jgi:hypothetical protein
MNPTQHPFPRRRRQDPTLAVVLGLVALLPLGALALGYIWLQQFFAEWDF